MHDDILDHADLRRGRPAAHTVFSITPTILAGDVLLALANEIVARTGNGSDLVHLQGHHADRHRRRSWRSRPCAIPV